MGNAKTGLGRKRPSQVTPMAKMERMRTYQPTRRRRKGRETIVCRLLVFLEMQLRPIDAPLSTLGLTGEAGEEGQGDTRFGFGRLSPVDHVINYRQLQHHHNNSSAAI